MDPRTMQGFLGTGAPLLQDITVLGYIILMIPAMLIGFSFARRHLFVPHHKYVMTSITLVNWAIIIYLMLASYRENVSHNVPQGLNYAVYLLPTLHLITGGLAQLIATVLVIRMWFENSLPRALRFEPIKPWMRLTLALWLITALLGISIYVTWYVIKPWPATTTPNNGDTPSITATEEATPDSGTIEATPEATPDDIAPSATEEATPAT
ncbi:MAG: hypothetical protein KF716_27145 [Anaerolineae bacterium]|nr:hypothetical protein [Anaerolineae bacterium]